ncbi:D-alanine--D-alanine ligase [Candidatus Persebacteraceae bacterium Df01]|jgi:D-alanine-D-alanine ligase|uniref:D-alanine--D-alanine ligase n=1 Tax=Candidatus Doriopsillibacter californiensis TaxID=2970740 RepID=A0ABT7QKM9_9GAMM|nr:D-alanine--D-alanine ligase [Candidatus Persebacteraceae bacterium Df01]
MTEKTILLLGGNSPEREISLMSGEMVLAALRRLDIKTETFDPATRPLTDITNTDMIRVFNILHGGAGENGEIRGALKTLGLACTGSGLLGSALAMDKHRTKLLWRGGGIPTPQWELATDATDAARVQEALGLPLFVKPSCGGSSTHAAVVRKSDELPAAIVAAASEGAPALVEQFVDGDEYTASIIDDTVLPLIGIRSAKTFYDYHAKYVAEDTQFSCPCGLPAEKEKQLQSQSLKAFQLLGCHHWGRVDFILTNSGVQFLEVNTIPGMTSHSLVPAAAKAAGIDYDTLVYRIWESAQ